MMLRNIFLIALVAFATAEKATFQNYKVFRITPKSAEHLSILQQLENSHEGYSYWRGPTVVDRSTDLMVAPGQLSEFTELMNSTGIGYEPFVDNVQRLIDQENPMTRASARFGWTRYHTLDEINDYLESLAKQYPDKIEVVVGGKSYQGREIKGVKLSFGANKKPGVFIEGGIHAREWITPATVTYLINQFLTSQEPQIRKLAEAHDWYFFPSVNPDGYVYTHTTNRMWRKTVSKNNLLCKGTDANRNWGYKWMSVGASSNPCADDYGGKSAFSEIETKTLSEYIKSVSDDLFAYIAFHSYSQLLIIPYCHTTQHLDNYDESYAIGRKALDSLAEKYGTKYTLGNAIETVSYYASGNSMDWVKSNFKLPIVFTYEMRDTGNYGFILPADQIIPNGEEVLASFITMFDEATKYGYPKEQ